MADAHGNAWGDLGPDPVSWSPTEPAADDAAAPDRATVSSPPPPAGPGLADVLDQAFRAVRGTWPTLLVATAVTATLLTAVDVALLAPLWSRLDVALLAPEPAPGTRSAPSAAALTATALEGAARMVLVAGTLLVTGVLAPALAPDPSTGEPCANGLRPLWARVRPRLPALAGASAAAAGVLAAASAVGAAPGLALALGAGDDTGRLLGAAVAVVGGLVGLVVALLTWGVAVCLAGPVAVLERRGPLASLARSRALTRRSRARVLGVVAVAVVLTWVVHGLVSAPFAGASAFLQPAVLGAAPQLEPTWWQVLITAGGVVASATFAYPLLAAVLTVLYLDLQAQGSRSEATPGT